MTDQSGISRNDAFLFGLEYALQVTCLSWYIDMQNLADDRRSLYCLLASARLPFLRLMERLLLKIQFSRESPFSQLEAMLFR